MADKRRRESGKTYYAAGSQNAVNCSNKSGFDEYRCTISLQTNLYRRNGFGSSEFTGKISPRANLQLCVLHTSMKVAFTSRESLCSMTVEKTYAQAVFDPWINSFKGYGRPLYFSFDFTKAPAGKFLNQLFNLVFSCYRKKELNI